MKIVERIRDVMRIMLYTYAIYLNINCIKSGDFSLLLKIIFAIVALFLFINIIIIIWENILYVLARKITYRLYVICEDLYEEILECERLRYKSYFIYNSNERNEKINFFTQELKTKSNHFIIYINRILNNEGAMQIIKKCEMQRLEEMLSQVEEILKKEQVS